MPEKSRDRFEPAGGDVTYELNGAGLTVKTAAGPRHLLRGVDLTIRTGEIVSIVGRSGTGKTTLLRILGGLAHATEGTALLGGVPIGPPPETAMTVFQDYSGALLPWRTVAHNIALSIEATVPRGRRDAVVQEMVDLVGLSGRERDYPWQLSGGMQQRTQIARALARSPRILLMDEPFGALDAMTKSSLQDELLTLQARTGATIVFITHDLEEAIYLSDRVCVIAGAPGRIVSEMPVELPRPRDQITTRESPEYLRIRHELGSLLKEPVH